MSLDQNSATGNSLASSVVAALRPVVSPVEGLALHWCELDRSTAIIDRVSAWLSDPERARAQRFGTTELRNRYIVGRASLRALLAERLDIGPEAIEIVRGRRGRPRLGQVPGIDFNVSHTAGTALFAIAISGHVGVDIERSDRRINARGIAAKFMPRCAPEILDAMADDPARRHVLRMWTCMEAMSKATGDALAAPFRAMQVELEPAPRLVDGPPPYDPERFSLYALDVPGAHFATAALLHDPA